MLMPLFFIRCSFSMCSTLQAAPVGDATKLFWLVLWVLDVAYSAIKFFFIEFSTSFIRQVAPLICFFMFFFIFHPKRPFFLYRPHQKNPI